MISYIATLTLAIAGIGFILYTMFKFLLDLRNSKAKITRDIDEFRAIVHTSMDTLAPWNSEELELLSTNHIDQKQSRRLDQEITGMITNIYHEPVVSYAYKQYLSGRKKAILIARTSTDEYIYKTESTETYLFINEERVGYIDHKYSLYSKRKKKLAYMDPDPNLSLLPIHIGDKIIAGFNNDTEGSAVNKRAVQLYKNISSEEEKIIMAYSILELVTNNID